MFFSRRFQLNIFIIILFAFGITQRNFAQSPTNFKFQNQSDNNSSLLILPLGNSITFDNRANDERAIEDKFGYRLPLYNFLRNTNIKFDFIGSEKAGGNFLPEWYDDNGGFPGIKDDQLANLLKTGRRVQPPNFDVQITSGPYLETYLPDVILLHIGTNGNNELNGTNPNDVEEILNEIDRVENLYNKEINVILARIIDRVPNESFVNEFNNNVEAMVLDRINNPLNPSYPDNIFMVDMEDSAMIDYIIDPFGTIGNNIPGDMSDYLHPNDKGYFKMANVWFNKLMDIYPNPITIVEQPKDFGTIPGLTATFSIHINSTDSVSFSWKKNGLTIPGANDSIFITDILSAEDDSAKIVCEINSKYYTAISDTALLFVSDSSSRVSGGLIALYNFEEAGGDTIYNKITEFPDLNLTIHNNNSVSWIPYGLKIVGNPGIYSVNAAKDIFEKCFKSNEITLEVWIEPENITQIGPARILTFSESSSNRNFTLGQDADKFEIRLRTTETSNNGIPSLFSKANSVKTNLTHIVYTRKNDGQVNLFINGEVDTNYFVQGNFSNWDSTYSLGLASEIMSNRLWLGKFYLTSIYNRALSIEEVLQNYSLKFNGIDDLLEKPTNLTGVVQNETDVLLNWVDNSIEELGFIIERKANKTDSLFKVIDSVGVDITTYIDSTQKLDSSYVYRIRSYNQNYLSKYSEEFIVNDIPVSVNNTKFISNKFQLYQNYPNPFNPSTQIKFHLAKASKVELKVYNSIGILVKTIYNNDFMESGQYIVKFDGKELSSGVYFYRLIAKPIDNSLQFIKSYKAILIK